MNQSVEGIVYFVQCPKHGPEHRIYGDDEEIRSQESIRAIEGRIEGECYWFLRLGAILGHRTPSGAQYDGEQFKTLLRLPERSRMRLGRLNPAFGTPEFLIIEQGVSDGSRG